MVMSKYTLYDLNLPSQFPQHSELNGGLCNASLHRNKRLRICQSNISKLCFCCFFKVGCCVTVSQVHTFPHLLLILNYNQ